MSYLIDTNIISEIRKGDRADTRVAAWYESIPEDDLYLSVLVLGEIRQGVERARRHDSAKATALEKWLAKVERGFGARVLAVTLPIAKEWGRMNAIRPLPTIDSLLGATARVHGLTLVTRNTGDLAGTGVDCLNPFEV